MPDIDWDDMVVPRNVPIVLQSYNDDTAALSCGICGILIAWTTDHEPSKPMAFGDLASSFFMHVDAKHRG